MKHLQRFLRTKHHGRPYMLLVHFAGITFTGHNMSTSLPLGQKARISLAPTDATGHAEEVINTTYASSDSAVATVDETGLITPVAVGVTTVTITAKTADDINTLEQSIDIVVTAAEAVTLGASVSLVTD